MFPANLLEGTDNLTITTKTQNTYICKLMQHKTVALINSRKQGVEYVHRDCQSPSLSHCLLFVQLTQEQ